MELLNFLFPLLLNQVFVVNCSTIKLTRTAWAVFKYCGTKTVPLSMKKNI